MFSLDTISAFCACKRHVEKCLLICFLFGSLSKKIKNFCGRKTFPVFLVTLAEFSDDLKMREKQTYEHLSQQRNVILTSIFNKFRLHLYTDLNLRVTLSKIHSTRLISGLIFNHFPESAICILLFISKLTRVKTTNLTKK